MHLLPAIALLVFSFAIAFAMWVMVDAASRGRINAFGLRVNLVFYTLAVAGFLAAIVAGALAR